MKTPAQVVDDFMLIRNLRAKVQHVRRQQAEWQAKHRSVN